MWMLVAIGVIAGNLSMAQVPFPDEKSCEAARQRFIESFPQGKDNHIVAANCIRSQDGQEI